MPTTAELLDLTNVSVRAESVAFELVDPAGAYLGELHPEAVAKIDNDASAQIKRRLTGLRIAASEVADVNPLSDRLRPFWLLSNGDRLPLGLFLFADASTQRFSFGTTLAGTCVDQGLILGQQLRSSIGFPADTAASTALQTVAEAAGIFTTSIAPSGYGLGSPLAWPAGTGGVTYAKVMEDLCSVAGYHSPYFSNTGTLTIRQATDLAVATPTFLYRDGGRIATGSMNEATDLLTAPNAFLVIDTSATTGDVSSFWPIPDDAPHSFARRGFYITKVVEAPGVGSVEQAAAVAQAAYRQHPQAYESVTWSSPADPRHDTFDVVDFRGVTYLETSWSLTLAPGGPMTHQAVRVYL